MTVQNSEFEKLWEVFSKKWNLRILKLLDLKTVIRFNELKQSVHGISSNLLSERLDELERVGLVKRIAYDETPIRIGYLLNEKCENLKKILLDLDNWISSYQFDAADKTSMTINFTSSNKLFEILQNEINETELKFIKDKLLFSNKDGTLDLITNFDKLKNIILELYGDYKGNQILKKLLEYKNSIHTN
ncbi:MAG: helix-turn-helix transcriptional regulator [Thaumarchaeota archaeon]|nr:helix-turn-helix transcriptional regulator [Nitrososphaerota archaeon]MBI3642296.1 helix-turn-helix transcriptional regulator [Nitrososphaerota archaeon]